MAQLPTRASFELHQIEPILSWAGTSGVDVDGLLHRLGIDPARRTDEPGTQIDLVDYYRIQREIARSFDDLTAQLSERKLLYQTGTFVVTQIQSASTLQDAIRSLASHFNMMHGGRYNYVRQSDTTLTLVVDDSTFPYRFRDDRALTHFVGDALLIKTHALLDSLTGGAAGRALKRVSLLRNRHDPGNGQLQFWQVPIGYGHAAYELIYDIDIACEKISPAPEVDLTADGIFARVIRHLESIVPSSDVRSFAVRTADLISDGFETQQAVARHMGLSVATLRRRLSEENTSFRDILQESRAERAGLMLAQGTSVTQVAEFLGYSDVRAFNRAFKKMRGISPAAYARMNAEAAGA
ncbi:MAG: helix-turn-helix domain-containing protein [Hyphomonas sp.]|nr:helix-turn-helix domain-containing protein [Hyphomonas sp.]